MICHHPAKISGHIKNTLLKGYMTKSLSHQPFKFGGVTLDIVAAEICFWFDT